MRTAWTTRRQLLAGAAAAILPRAAWPESRVLAFWVSTAAESPSQRLDVAMAKASQVGVMGSAKTGSVAATLLGGGLLGAAAIATMSHSQAERELASHAVFQGLTLEQDFEAARPRDLLDPSLALAPAPDEQSAQVRIQPAAVLAAAGAGKARMMMLCDVTVDAPGLRRFSWNLEVQAANERPIGGEDGWTGRQGDVLRQAVREQVPDMLRAIARETALRQRREWADPVDPARLVHINMPWWESNVFWSYLVLDETDTRLTLAQARRGLGHLLPRRSIFDKSLIRAIERPS
jgi:hypothetical protein